MCNAAVKRPPRIQRPLLLCWLSLFWLLVGCGSVAPVLKIGLVGPFEGQNRAIGYDVIYSARLAVREINRQGIGPYRLALVALDDSSDPQLAQETAVSLTLDPAVIAVIGHWDAQTTAVAAPIYAAAGLPFLPAGHPPLGPYPPTQLPADFQAAYAAITPFDETPGPYAGSTYDAMQLLWQTLTAVQSQTGQLTRQTLAAALPTQTYQGMTGPISWFALP